MNEEKSEERNIVPIQNGSQWAKMKRKSPLRRLVVSIFSILMTVYWIGPVAGDTYSIFVPKTGVTVVRYIPAGASVTDVSLDFRLVATYVQKNAFATTQLAGRKNGNLGFINIDGNAVFYVKSRPTNVYVGIKGRDVQLEIFDPGQDQAVALALFRGQIQQIK